MSLTSIIRTILLLPLIIFLTTGCNDDDPASPEDPSGGITLSQDEIDTIHEDSDFDFFEFDEEDYTVLDPTTPPVLMEAPAPTTASAKMVERIYEILDNLVETQYVHNSGRVMDEANGIYKYDCSGFVGDFVIKQTMPNHYNDLIAANSAFHSSDSRPRAWLFYDYFRDILGDKEVAENSYWKVFTSIDSVKQGDIIVARYSDEWRAARKAEGKSASTGHVMVAWSPAYPVDGGKKALVLITDCAMSGHHNDTRTILVKEELFWGISTTHEKNISGIGKGWMWFGISTLGDRRPYKYQWKSSTAHYYNLSSLESSEKYGRLKGIIMARPIGNL